jgi:prepilin-type N-terminal cleavage/methylation domain-containing protein
MKFYRKDTYRKNTRGFTLIELLVVVAIIGLLASVILASLNIARAKARDAKRFSDLHQIQTALEMYYSDHGSYPLPYGNYAYNVASPVPTIAGNYTKYCNTLLPDGTTSGTNAYIQGLTPYMSVLPSDPGGNSTSDCDVYLSNGIDYLFVEAKTIEGTVPASLVPPIGGAQSAGVYSPGASSW